MRRAIKTLTGGVLVVGLGIAVVAAACAGDWLRACGLLAAAVGLVN